MIRPLSRRERLALLAGVIVVLGVPGVVRGVPAWTAWRANTRTWATEAVGLREARAAALRDLPEALDTAEARVRRLRVLGPALLVAEGDAAAASELAGVIGEAARLSLVTVHSLDAAADTARSGRLRHVSARLHARTDVLGLADFLGRLEGGTTLLDISALSVRAVDVATPAGQPGMLVLEMTVEALALLRAPAAEGGK